MIILVLTLAAVQIIVATLFFKTLWD